MRLLILFLCPFILLNSQNIFCQNNNYTADTTIITSSILNEDRQVIIIKPANILKDDTVQFLYLLDGENSPYIYHEIKNHFKNSLNNLIVIGIVNTDRRRDMLYINGADQFLDFITSELIPSLEKDYRTSARILHGHSFCGSFTVYSLINKPEYFDYFLASSPTPIMGIIDQEIY